MTTARTKMLNGTLGDLEMPQAHAEDTDKLEVDGFPIYARFGSVFEPIPEIEGRWTPVIPFFVDGFLYREWVQHGGDTQAQVSEKDGDIRVVVAHTIGDRSLPPSIERGVLYYYDASDFRMEGDFELIAKNLPTGSLLVLPPLGTNNGISFSQSAFRMFYSLLACLGEPNSAVRSKLSGVLFLVPFEIPRADGEKVQNASARTIQHIFNLMRVYRATRNEPDCCVCSALKADTILMCGHRLCMRCVLAVGHASQACPLCRRAVGLYHPCYRVVDSSAFKCCAALGEAEAKEQCIFVPCGHHGALCKACGDIVRRDRRPQCKVCGEAAFAYMRVYLE